MPEIKDQTDNAEFVELVGRLKARYQDWELPHIFLTRKLDCFDVPVKISELAELALEAFLTSCAGMDDFDPNDPRLPKEPSHNVALHAVAALQHKLVELFEKGENQSAYMLLVSDEGVQWSKWREGMEEFIKDRQRQQAG